MSTFSANIESHIVSILKTDVSEDQMMDSNSRLEGDIRQENLIGSTDTGEMCLSEARLQSVRVWSATLPMPNRKYVSIRGRNVTTPSHPPVQGAGHYV